MDSTDGKMINLPRDGNPGRLEELLNKVGYSHNTLRLHLDELAKEGVIYERKLPSEGAGEALFRILCSFQLQEVDCVSFKRVDWCGFVELW